MSVGRSFSVAEPTVVCLAPLADTSAAEADPRPRRSRVRRKPQATGHAKLGPAILDDCAGPVPVDPDLVFGILSPSGRGGGLGDVG